MAVKVYKSGSYIRIDDALSPSFSIEYMYPSSTVPIASNTGLISLVDDIRNKNVKLGLYTNIQDQDGNSFDTQSDALKYLANLGSQDVNIQDQTTPPVDFFFIQAKGAPTTLSAATEIDDLVITIAATANFTDGTWVAIFKPADNRFFFAEQIGAPATNDITLDTPLDYAFEIGDTVLPATRELNVDGSTTAEVFAVQGAGTSSTVSIDITRIIIAMTCDSLPDDGLFGNIAALAKGLVLRRIDGDTRNIWNVKTNGDFANLAYDVAYTTRSVPIGSYGMRCRYTLAGQDKHGVAVRLKPGDALQLIIQDDLEDILSFRAIAAGHVVED